MKEFETENAARNSDLWHITGIKAFIENAPTAYNQDKVIHKIHCHYIDRIDDADREETEKLKRDNHVVCEIVRNGGNTSTKNINRTTQISTEMI